MLYKLLAPPVIHQCLAARTPILHKMTILMKEPAQKLRFTIMNKPMKKKKDKMMLSESRRFKINFDNEYFIF